MTGDEELLETFLRFETEHSVFDIHVDGIPIWERLRRHIYPALTAESENSTDTHDERFDPTEALKGVWLWGSNLVFKNPYFAGEHTYLSWGHQRRKLQENDHWWDIYFDPFYEAVDVDYSHLEVAHWTTHLTPAETENLRYMDFPVYTGTIARKLFSSYYPLDAEDRSRLESVETALHDRFGVDIDLVPMVKKKLTQRRVRKPLYRLLLDRVRPEIVMLVISYHRETFVEVCKEMDIPVVELQHGVIHSGNLEYSYPGNRPKQTFPDYLFVFGDYWKDAVEFPLPKDRIYSVGYPYFESQSERYANRESTERVVFLSQPTIGDSLYDFAVEFAEQSDLPVVYKLHPHEYDNWKERYPRLEQSSIRVVCDEPPLYELLAESTVQVGVRTTVLYEGLNFDLDTYIFDDVQIHVSRLADTSYATRISTIAELSRQIATTASNPVDVDKFFKSNAIQNMQDALEDILEDQQTEP